MFCQLPNPPFLFFFPHAHFRPISYFRLALAGEPSSISLIMDPVGMEKLQAMRKYRKIQFLENLFQYFLTALVVILCLSKSVWFPSLCSPLTNFFSVTLPKIGAYVVEPRCMFVVCNIIVAVLISELKLVSPGGASPNFDMYDEYVRQTQNLRKRSFVEAKERYEMTEVRLSAGFTEKVEEVGKEEEDGGGEEKEEEDEDDEKEETEKASYYSEEEEETGLPADELYKRAEDFIARVNQQRRLEAKLLVYSEGD